ncbi:hypothetical protein R3W88_011987 [Solanum pinnatisectum]|uniref:Uncharacterized protein n=1 Tax=Solanum pinnatisectum TaxID=50273 RepID=A0AAV9L8R8_9SOLN|nr:hypothetical protein R3W88_011987 [Solanum pinnatisectum]
MSQSPSSLKKMLDSLNEIDLVAFYISSDISSPSKMSTISPVNIAKASPPNPLSPIDLNNPAPSHQPGVYPSSDSREGVMNEEGDNFVEDILKGSQPMFDQTPEIGVYPSSDSINIDEDNLPLKLTVQRKMVPISTKGNEKVIEEKPRRRSFTRSDSKKLMGDAMKSSKRKSGDALFEMPATDVVDVSIEGSEHECVGEDSPLGNVREKKGKRVKKTSKGKAKASVVKKVTSAKEKGDDLHSGRESSKRRRETSSVIQPVSAPGPGLEGNEDDHVASKQSIINNLHIQKVLGGLVFDPDITTKHGMDSLYDLVEIQSWTHLFQIKSLVLHEEKV